MVLPVEKIKKIGATWVYCGEWATWLSDLLLLIENQIMSELTFSFMRAMFFYECTYVVDIVVLGLVKGWDVPIVSTQHCLHLISPCWYIAKVIDQNKNHTFCLFIIKFAWNAYSKQYFFQTIFFTSTYTMFRKKIHVFKHQIIY